jgi:shikimate kinase
MPHVEGVSLSGTGPSVVAVGDPEGLEAVEERWRERPGETLRTETRATGGRYL